MILGSDSEIWLLDQEMNGLRKEQDKNQEPFVPLRPPSVIVPNFHFSRLLKPR